MLLFLSIGCADNEVEVDGYHEFGVVESATWARIPTGDGSDEPDVIILSTVEDHCEKLRAYTAAEAALAVAAEMASAAGYCAALEEPTATWAEAGQQLHPQGARSASFRIGAAGAVPTVGTWPTDADDDPLFAWMIYAGPDAFEPYLAEWDAAGEGPACGIESGSAGWGSMSWIDLEGALTLAEVSADATATGTFEGTGAPGTSDPDFDVSASFTATFCDVGAE